MLNKDLINIIVNYVGFYKDLDFEIPFFEKHLDKVDWTRLSENSNIPVTFFEKQLKNENKDKVDLYNLSGNSNIPVTFFEKHLENENKNKINWYGLSGNTGIPLFYNKLELIKIIYSFNI